MPLHPFSEQGRRGATLRREQRILGDIRQMTGKSWRREEKEGIVDNTQLQPLVKHQWKM